MATEIVNDEVGMKLTRKVAAMAEGELWQRFEELTTKRPNDTMNHEELREFVKLLFGPEADLGD